MNEDRFDALASVIGWRLAIGGSVMLFAPRLFRGLMADLMKLSDSELRLMGYALLGGAGIVALQQVTKRALAGRFDAATQARRAGAA
jgi:uncharacterized protein YjeT (DUF2065 family)